MQEDLILILEIHFIPTYDIPKTKIKAKLNSGADSSSVLISNNAMEVNANGKFSLSSLIDVVLYNISTVSNIVEKKLNPDSSISYADLSGYNHTGNVNFNYEFVTKDSAELRKLSTPFGIIINGDLNGSLSNTPEGFNSKSVMYIKNFRYQDTAIVLNNFKSNIALTNDYMKLNNETSFIFS